MDMVVPRAMARQLKDAVRAKISTGSNRKLWLLRARFWFLDKEYTVHLSYNTMHGIFNRPRAPLTIRKVNDTLDCVANYDFSSSSSRFQGRSARQGFSAAISDCRSTEEKPLIVW